MIGSSFVFAVTSLVGAFSLGVKYGQASPDSSIWSALRAAVRDGASSARNWAGKMKDRGAGVIDAEAVDRRDAPTAGNPAGAP